METAAIPQETVKELTSTLFIIKGLTKELEKERDVIVTSASQLSVCTRQFQGSVKDFGELSPKVIEELKASINESSQLIAKKVSEETVRLFMEKSVNRLDDSLTKLDQKSVHINHEMEQALKKMSMLSKGSVIAVLVATLFGGLIGGGLVHYLYPPINEQISKRLQAGEMLSKAWPKLTPKEREKIASLS